MDSLDAIKIMLEGATYDGCSCESFSDEMGNGSTAEVETSLMLFGMMRRLKPQMVLTTGTHYGVTDAFIALALKENGKYNPEYRGRVITIDSNLYDGRAQALWDKLELDNIRQIYGDSTDPETYKRINIDHPLDVVWYDADHSTESIVAEFDATYPFLFTDHCLLMWHDSRLDVRMSPGIAIIISKLKELRANGRGWKLLSPWPWRNMRGVDMLWMTNEDFIS